jgi:nucleotide-binding universal stress UspA family protein
VLVFRGPLPKSYAIQKIMIAWDGSEESQEVVLPAAEMAAAVGASVVLVHVGKKFPPLLPLALKVLGNHNIAARTRLLSGAPAEAILQAADEENVNLLALTTTGQTKKNQLFFGSVAEELLKKSAHPLLVVHTGRVA